MRILVHVFLWAMYLYVGILYAYGLIICLQDGLSKLYIYPGDLACSWIKEHLNQRKLAIARTVTMHAAQSELTCY